MAMNDIGNGAKYSQEYLNSVKNVLANRIDGNGGDKDNKVTIKEAYNDLNIGDLLSSLKDGSNEYNKLKALTDNIPNVLTKYAGSDGVFKTEEWADFINGKEWGAVLDLFHSLKNSAKTEKSEAILKKIDNTEFLKKDEKQVIKDKLKAIAKRYAGRDYRFTIMEYNVMLNDREYQDLKNKLYQFNQDFE